MSTAVIEIETEVVCYCSGTNKQQIEALIAEGVVDLDRISRITGAGSGCGSCEYDLQQMLPKQD
jgi:bacterioferritin-associated ferredoxin